MHQQPKRDTNRIDKVNSKIQHELGPILKEHLEGLDGLVTISKVETSKDMKWAKIWISIFGGNDDLIFKRINSEIYDIQGELNHSFTTKIVPRLQFFLDTSPRYVEHIEEVIKKIHSENDINDKNDGNDKN